MLQNPNLADVRPGDEIDGFYLLTDATVRTSSNGSRYLSATLCDRSGSLTSDRKTTVRPCGCADRSWTTAEPDS